MLLGMRLGSGSTILLRAALVGCSGGQTGSPSCVNGGGSCVCRRSNRETPLRVHVESYEAGRVVAVIEQTFATSGANGLIPGERVGGTIRGGRPCATEPVGADLAGSELLVAYVPAVEGNFPDCSAFESCAATECASFWEPELTDCWNACAERTEASCAGIHSAALLNGVFSWAIRWTDSLDFGGGNELPASEVDVLASYDTCVERYPEPTAPPCDMRRSAEGCGAARSAPEQGGGAWLLGLVALVCGVRRRLVGPR